MKNLIIIILVILSVNCKGQDNRMKNSPIVTVIKLQSAESLLNFEEAKKYIDLKKVFKDNPESTDVEKEWKEMITFFYNLGKDKKFTNQFKYYDYNIIELIDESKAEVKFIPIDQDSKKIFYSLELKNNTWIVIDIKHIS